MRVYQTNEIKNIALRVQARLLLPKLCCMKVVLSSVVEALMLRTL